MWQQILEWVDPLIPYVKLWGDAVWLPVVLIVMHKAQKLMAAIFVAFSMLMLRMQNELLEEIEFPNGLTGLIEMSSLHRGMIVFAIGTFIYCLLSYISPRTKGAIYMAASLTIFFTTSLISICVMVI